MIREMLFAVGFCSSLFVTSEVADAGGGPASGIESAGADVSVTGSPTGEETGAVTGGTRRGAQGTTVTSEGKAEVEADVGRGRSRGEPGKPKRAGTGTAAGYIHGQVKKGNVKIQGATDADIYK